MNITKKSKKWVEIDGTLLALFEDLEINNFSEENINGFKKILYEMIDINNAIASNLRQHLRKYAVQYVNNYSKDIKE